MLSGVSHSIQLRSSSTRPHLTRRRSHGGVMKFIGIAGLVGVSRLIMSRPKINIGRHLADAYEEKLSSEPVLPFEDAFRGLCTNTPYSQVECLTHEIFKSLGVLHRVMTLASGPSVMVLGSQHPPGVLSRSENGENVVAVPVENQLSVVLMKTPQSLFELPITTLGSKSLESELIVNLGGTQIYFDSGEVLVLDEKSRLTMISKAQYDQDKVDVDIRVDHLGLDKSIDIKGFFKFKRRIIQAVLATLGFAYNGFKYSMTEQEIADSTSELVEKFKLGELSSKHIQQYLQTTRSIGKIASPYLSRQDVRTDFNKSQRFSALRFAARVGLAGFVKV